MTKINARSHFLRIILVALGAGGCAPALDLCSVGDECREEQTEGEKCAPGFFQAESGKCQMVTSCSSEQYEFAPPTTDTDRICEDLSVCDPGSFVEKAPEFDRDRSCRPCPENTTSALPNAPECEPAASVSCRAGQFESAGGCHDTRACDDDEFEFFPATDTSDTVCRPITQCQPGEEIAYLPGATRDRVCKPCDPEMYSSVVNAERCLPWTTCNDDPEQDVPQLQAIAPTSATDRQCADSFCGDGVTDPRRGEACDDGSNDDTGWCLENCSIDSASNLPACNSDADCETGQCYQAYVDYDDDLHSGTPLGKYCLEASHPGFSIEKTDCCDSDPRAHMGQAGFFSEPTACGGFDYDCDEEESQGYLDETECIEAGDARLTVPGWTGARPDCGVSAEYALLDASEKACGALVETRTQLCR